AGLGVERGAVALLFAGDATVAALARLTNAADALVRRQARHGAQVSVRSAVTRLEEIVVDALVPRRATARAHRTDQPTALARAVQHARGERDPGEHHASRLSNASHREPHGWQVGVPPTSLHDWPVGQVPPG